MKTKDCFTELAIKIATVDMKLDAILKLLNKPDVVDYEITNVINIGDHMHTGNLATSLDEQFTENFK